MGFRLEQVFPAMDDNDGYGIIAQFPDLPDHPDFSGDSGPPYLNHTRLYPFNQRWYWMNDAADYGPILNGEEPASVYNSMDGDPWFAGHAVMPDDAGSRQYGFQWYATSAVTADHNNSYVGHVFAMRSIIDDTKTESSSYYLSYWQAERDTGSADDKGHLDAAYFGQLMSFGHGGDGSFTTMETEYSIGYKAAVVNVKGTIHNAFAYEAQPLTNGGTLDLYIAFYANAGIGSESAGFWAKDDLKSIWEFQESDIITGNTTDLLLGDGTKKGGKQYHVTSDGSYNIDGIVAEGVNRDGAEVLMYNGNASYNFTVIDNGAGGSAATGNKVFPTTGANLAWNAGTVLHLRYNRFLDTNQGGWIAWVT